MIEYSSEEEKIIEEDKKFNAFFELKDVRQFDLLLLSSVELNIGQAKCLKEKVRTVEDFLPYVQLDHVALALVVETKHLEYSDVWEHIQVQVSENKRSFIEK